MSGATVLVGAQVPPVMSVPRAVSSRAAVAIELADAAGVTLDAWQRLVLTGGLGVRADGGWAAPEVGLCIPRQNGKSLILAVRELAGLFEFGERLLLHSAHLGATSLESFGLLLDLIEAADLDARVRRVTRARGSEAIETIDGGRILFRARSRGSGRGLGVDAAVLDEAQTLSESSYAALVPTLAGPP